MGDVNFGAPVDLVIFLKKHFNINTFVETGTFRGDSAAWAAQHFEQVYTIEAHAPLWEAAQNRYSSLSNITFIHGSSPERLRILLPKLDNALFWLDAHWCGKTAGEDDECPLLAELEAIRERKIANPVILIDDARLFLSPPPPPHKWRQWPHISALISALNQFGNPYVIIKDDAIVAVPQSACPELAEFLRLRQQQASSRKTEKKSLKAIFGLAKRIPSP
jgi:hypothetical protein